MLKFSFAFLLMMLVGTASYAGTTYPDVLNMSKPSPEPAFPAGFDIFVPPVSSIPAVAGAPALAEWTKTGQPDSVVALTGSRLSNYTGTQAGRDTQFQVFGQSSAGTYSGAGSVLRLDGLKAAMVLPAALPTDSEYLMWPINSFGAGNPIAVNATESWWIGPNAATRGDTVSVYGRNLSHHGSSVTSYIYIQKNGMTGTWATVTAANPYKVDFTVPAGLVDGDYQVWVHNGHGGHYGWSGPLTLTVNDGMPWTAQQFNVKNYGALGDGVTDDEAAINAAMIAAGQSPWSTLYFPTGIYMVSRGFYFPSQVRWLGDGPTKTFLKANSGFVTPTAYDGRRYCLLFSNNGISSATFQDMTIDANGNMNGYLPEAIYMRFDQDLRFINVNINAKGYSIGDFHGSTRVSFENCGLTGGGSGIFFGSATQVFIDHCQIYGTNDANTLLTWWGGDGMSCTNTTAQDYDNTQPDGWAQGRFFYGSSQWGSNRDIYIGNDTTHDLAVRPAFADQNSGEQVAWENGTKYSAQPTSASATTVVFGSNPFFQDPGLLTGNYDAAIVNGPGLGQHRKIVGCTGAIITVSPAWNVPPDTNSTVIIAGVVSHCAIYENTLQGKSDYVTRDTASAGVQPYGNSFDFVVDSNDISQVRHGIYMWGTNETSVSPESVTCDYFNYIANNNVHDCTNGIYGVSVAWNGWPTTDPYPGISYLANTVVNNTVDSITDSGLATIADSAPIGDQLDLSVYDHNLVTHTPDGLDVSVDSRLLNTIDYKNDLYVGAAPEISTLSVASMTIAPAPNGIPTVAPRQVVVPAIAAVVKSMSAPALASAPKSPLISAATPTVASKSVSVPALPVAFSLRLVGTPVQVLSLSGSSLGAVVATSLSLASDGTPSASWSVTSDSSWLGAGLTVASGANADAGSTLTLTCNPHALHQGVYSGIVTVRSLKSLRRYTLIFTVGAAPATSALVWR
jgi:polygalacturonase